MKHTTSAGGIILNNKNEVLIIFEDNYFYGLPKGTLKSGEDELATAKREIKEETGLSELIYIDKLGSYQRHPVNEEIEDIS